MSVNNSQVSKKKYCHQQAHVTAHAIETIPINWPVALGHSRCVYSITIQLLTSLEPLMTLVIIL